MDAEQVRSSAIAHECAVFEDFVEALRIPGAYAVTKMKKRYRELGVTWMR